MTKTPSTQKKLVLALLVIIMVASIACTPQQRPESEKYGTKLEMENQDLADNNMDFFDGKYDNIMDGDRLPGQGRSYLNNDYRHGESNRLTTNITGRNDNQTLEREIEKMEDITEAVVIRDGATCYVGIDSNPNTKLETPGAFRTQIASRIRGLDSNIERVYVTTDENGLEKLKSFAKEINLGQPIKKYKDELEQIFQ